MIKGILSNKWLIVVTLLFVFYANDVWADKFSDNCQADIFREKYENAGCWSCNIISTLLNAFLTISQILFDSFVDLSEILIQVGGAIWIAVFFLKTLGSMSAQDPMKVMDALFLFMVKWAFVYALIIAGIDEIIGMIVNPILSIGFDIGMTFAAGVNMK